MSVLREVKAKFRPYHNYATIVETRVLSDGKGVVELEGAARIKYFVKGDKLTVEKMDINYETLVAVGGKNVSEDDVSPLDVELVSGEAAIRIICGSMIVAVGRYPQLLIDGEFSLEK